MRVGRRLWWVIGVLLVLLCIGFILAAYQFGWSGTGFSHKTLWDWLQLLIIPLVLAVVALLFNLATTRTEQKIAAQRYEQDQHIALDKQREDLLQAYLDRISELLLKENLRSSAPGTEVQNVARVRTVTVLCQLDARRISYVFAFLREAGLMSNKPNNSIVSLSKADLSKVNWSEANLSAASLSGADLSGADLSGALLYRADLSRTNLSKADLSGAHLNGANLNKANMNEANLSEATLSGADLSGATLSKANLSAAKLRGADLSEADFSGANLSRADLNSSKLNNTLLIKEQIEQAKPSTNA